MKVVIQSRANVALSELNIHYQVERYAHSAWGGPQGATIQVSGDELDLWQLIERVRCPIKIYSDYGDCTWWGYIAEIQLSLGLWNVGVSIDTMYNYIAVAYENQDGGGLPTLTAWTEDTQSTGEYGRRELLLTTNGSTATHATAARDAALAQKRWPIPVIRPNPGGTPGQATGTLYCRGWADTLSWRYYANAVGLEEFAPSGSTSQNLGDVAANERIAQGFQIPSAWTGKALALKVTKVGAPVDNLTFAIYSNVAGAPGVSLASGVVAGAGVGTTSDWIVVSLGAGYALAATTAYWIVVTRSGAADPDNYYVFEVSEDLGYTDGTFVIYGGASWAARDPDADMAFRLTSTEDTAIQAATMADAGEFIAAVDRENAAGAFISGIVTNQYRDGYANILYELSELLKMGTSNYKRMLFAIDENRRLRIYEEPASTSPYLLQKDGSLRDYGDRPIRNDLCPAGVWARLKEIIPPSVDTTKLSDPSLMFIETAEYEPASNALILTPRGVENVYDIGGIADG